VNASPVALTQVLPIAVATVGFYIAYRLFEDYLLTPRCLARSTGWRNRPNRRRFVESLVSSDRGISPR
jgi:hypothetical protein